MSSSAVIDRKRKNPESQTKPGTVARPRFESLKLLLLCQSLRLFVQFNSVAGVNIFHGEHDHSSRCGWCGSDDDNLAYGAPWQIADVNHRAVPLSEHARIERR